MLTIDVEDWFQVENLRPWIPNSTWDSYTLRVQKNTMRLLELFDKTGKIQATFFILGWIAKRLPKLIHEIQNRGHEVASHGFDHDLCKKLDPQSLKNDLERSKKLLEDISGNEVRGYRAPNFSINDDVIKIARTIGYQYDSSYNNFSKHGRYSQISINGNKRQGIAIQITDDFHELPISNLKLGSQILPWGGGGYFRFIPFPIFKTGIRKILNTHDAYMFYMHPWEIDPEQPKVKESKGLSGWRHYLNLDKTYSRLTQLITTFNHCDFLTCSQYLENH